MVRLLRRIVLASPIVGGIAVAVRRRAGRRSVAVMPSAADAAWPAIITDDSPTTTWTVPVDGQCPVDHPLKASDNSRIFHVPGGRFYDRTKAQRCYADGADAIADGYRPAKA
jgi:hypothetical protein